jgi:hypothetical protein
VKELLQSHTKELSNDLLELEKELSDDNDESSHVVLVKHLTTKQLAEIVKCTDTTPGITDGNDANRKRNAKVA